MNRLQLEKEHDVEVEKHDEVEEHDETISKKSQQAYDKAISIILQMSSMRMDGEKFLEHITRFFQ